MKKLIAGIFTVMLGLCAANNADAAVASQDYVDSKVGDNTTAIETLTQTVATNAETAANATAAVAKDLADYESANDAALVGVKTTAEQGVADAAAVSTALGEYKTSNDARVQAVEGDVTTLQQDIAKVQGGELALKDGSVAKSKLTTELQAEIDSFATPAEMEIALASKGDRSDVEANASAISAINNTETGILAEAKKYADANDADTIYDDAEVKADIVANAQAIAENRLALAEKMNITSAKTETGKYVFTANVGENGVTDYAWELIAREREEYEGEE